MSDGTKIQWTDATWSVTRGCSRVSDGCKNCYAERMAHRFSGEGGPFAGLTHATAEGPRWTGEVRLVPEALELPLHWRKPRRIFVDSMSDLFHKDVPDEFISKVLAVISLAPRHTFQLLTKRPERMSRLFRSDCFWDLVDDESSMLLEDEDSPVGPGRGWNGLERRSDDARATAQCPTVDEPLSNLWAGVSVENQHAADERIPLLLETPAAVRWISAEPLLGDVGLFAFLRGAIRDASLAELNCPTMPGLDWVVAGGESGPSARPVHPDWVRSIRDQCQSAGVPFFFKSWGEWSPIYSCDDDPDARTMPNMFSDRRRWINSAGGHGFHGKRVVAVERVGKKRAGRELDGREWSEFPEAG